MTPRLRDLVLALLLLALTAITTTLAWGPAYAAALLAILVAHEMGHFLMCRRHGVLASYPIFLPVPPPFLFGTLGAVIRIRAPFPDRKALFDIGVAGPLAGFAVAVPVAILGLSWSHVAMVPDAPGLRLGDGLLFRVAAALMFGPLPSGQDIFLHPVALAGWAGLFVTGLNLLPIGQLDGGHIARARFGRRGARTATRLALVGFALLTLFVYNYWVLALALAALVARRPAVVIDDVAPIDRRRRAIGAAALAVFALTFTPVPILDLPSLWDLVRDAL